MSKFKEIYTSYFVLLLIIICGILIRMYFSIGHIFSDDAYYSNLSYSIINSNFKSEYLGYPVFSLRVAYLGMTAFSMLIFGANEIATIVFPLVFSLLNIILTYKISHLLTDNKNIALTAAVLAALFPTDIIFASMAFPDLINIFFINLGLYLLIKSYLQNKKYIALLGGVSLFLSMQFKESTYYVMIMLVILSGYILIKNRRLNHQLMVGIFFIIGNYLVEGFIYLLLHNDFFYRVTITNINYQYSYYDFFPHTAQKLSNSKNYFRNLFDQIFLINAKSVFLRRFYLFLPIVASVQTFFSARKNAQPLLIFWFWGTTILLIAFTTSFSEYKPLDLTRSWYIYPILMPMVILTSIFINRFSKLMKNGLIAIYILGSLIMCFHYQIFFDKDNLTLLKSFLRENFSKTIYTDHFTKYSVDLIRGYKEGNSKRISGKDFKFSQIKTGDWVLLNKKHIEELEMQSYQFPDFTILNVNTFRKVAAFNEFVFYEKVQ